MEARSVSLLQAESQKGNGRKENTKIEKAKKNSDRRELRQACKLDWSTFRGGDASGRKGVTPRKGGHLFRRWMRTLDAD